MYCAMRVVISPTQPPYQTPIIYLLIYTHTTHLQHHRRILAAQQLPRKGHSRRRQPRRAPRFRRAITIEGIGLRSVGRLLISL